MPLLITFYVVVDADIDGYRYFDATMSPPVFAIITLIQILATRYVDCQRCLLLRKSARCYAADISIAAAAVKAPCCYGYYDYVITPPLIIRWLR